MHSHLQQSSSTMIKIAVICLSLLCLRANASEVSHVSNIAPHAFLFETFDEGWSERWVHSSDEKYKGEFAVKKSQLTVNSPSKFYGLTSLLSKPLDPSKGLVVQYEVTYKKGYECGGSYLKLLTHVEGFEAQALVDSTPYSVMFGPDKCGDPSGKIHFIVRHEAPNGTISEKHRKPHPAPVTDKLPHVYTLIITPENHVEIRVDGEVKTLGPITEHMEPPINPPKEIPDPDDIKPSDWVDEETIPDPDASQPEDWDTRRVIPDEAAVKPSGWLDDEPQFIPDPAAKKPSGWDNEEDGEWEAPTIPNPKCKNAGCGEWSRPTKPNPAYQGEWRAPRLPNPAYKGKWIQKNISNPDFYHDPEPLKNIGLIGAVAFEIWTIDEGYTFDNIYVGQSVEEAASLRQQLWEPNFQKAKKEAEEKAQAEKAAEKLKQSKQKREGSKVHGLPLLILDAFDSGFLKAYKPFVAPILDVIRESPFVVYLAIVTPVLVLIGVLIFRRPSSRRGEESENVRAKKFDEATPDDDDDVDVNEDKKDAPGGKTVKEAATSSKQNKVSAHEISATEGEEEEEEDAPQGATTRRRTRKA
ncbi:hypothetical protein CEUSTIGMA_g12405.t1 [Chlamydomonas eustigma]|uniref:Calnexin n=1 Tax=Chlamydomonas eustigma TaxID=1157962 RepID=A0A250XPH1_9CHLO|nr:hypothetical protein CEUSTIGMA_g12405.t1 [Chlamydomonas eustigma]|eukprot:GAX84984.1 hypothetical protein CEUSTIGMA_g12405.t1 [Chlamydomonas eustigma]